MVEAHTEPPKTVPIAKNGTMKKVRIGIYLLVVLFSSYAIVLGTTLFNEFDRMLMSGLVAVLTIPIFVWLGIELLQRKKLRN